MKLYSFANGFKRTRKNAGYTQESFVQHFLDENRNEIVTLKTVRNWEQGRAIPEFRTIQQLCDFFNCDMDYLFDRMECRNHDLEFIHEYTGLSEEAIEELHKLKTYYQGEIRLCIINYLLCDGDFRNLLTDNIGVYYKKYVSYKKAQEKFFEEEKKIDTITNGDIIKKIKLQHSGTYTPTMNRHKLSEKQDLQEAAHFKIQKDFDNILNDLIKYFYEKNNHNSSTID